jgi:hypothetical protein
MFQRNIMLPSSWYNQINLGMRLVMLESGTGWRRKGLVNWSPREKERRDWPLGGTMGVAMIWF